MSEKDGLEGLEGRPVDPAALAGNPFERKSSWRSAFRAAGTRGLAAAALAVGVLVLGLHLRPANQAVPTAMASPGGTIHLTAANPRALRLQIVDELHAVGVQANGYGQLGIDGVDADLPLPITPDVSLILEKHAIAVPADGLLRIQISTR